MSHDLAIIGGHVIDPASGLDAVTDIAFKNGQVSAIGADAEGIIVSDQLGWNTPGLDDFLVVVDVIQEGVQRPQPLLAAFGQAVPFTP